MPATATMNAVKIGTSNAGDPVTAAAELAEQVAQPGAELVLYFSTARHDPDLLARAMSERFPGISVGCTTAGEIGPQGYVRETIVALGLGEGPIRVHRFPIESVSSLDLEAVAACRQRFEEIRAYPGGRPADDCFGMLLIDGLSLREEHLVASLYSHFQPMPIVGGSAGDDFRFRETQVFSDARAIRNGAVFLVFEMGGVPFQTFRLQDFAPISDSMVITGADSERRRIYEIDGEPATDVYSRLVGVPPDQMTHEMFASHSFMVQLRGEEYIRSVRSIESDGSLCLYSAIDQGVVVRMGRSDDTLVGLSRFLEPGAPRAAGTQLAVCFDCIHRRIELTKQGGLARAAEILGQMPTIGFSTYGEIADSIHVNQTMTGVLLGWRDDSREQK
jgi:hypothetical protein